MIIIRYSERITFRFHKSAERKTWSTQLKAFDAFRWLNLNWKCEWRAKKILPERNLILKMKSCKMVYCVWSVWLELVLVHYYYMTDWVYFHFLFSFSVFVLLNFLLLLHTAYGMRDINTYLLISILFTVLFCLNIRKPIIVCVYIEVYDALLHKWHRSILNYTLNNILSI